MPVPLLDLKAQYKPLREEILRVTDEVFESQQFILGKRVDAFEADFAAYCHAKHSVGLSSGTDALLIALMVLGVGPDDEVIVPAYSFFATAGVVSRLGAKPVFVDINPDDFNIAPTLIEEKITDRTKVIMPVHLFGQMADMEPIMALARKRNIAVIEDAAQAVGSEYAGTRAGNFGVIGAFSFFPSKNLGAFGDAGAVTTNDSGLYERLIDYRVHGMRPRYFHHYVGGNFRIDALQAAILHVKLKHLDTWTEGRRRNAARYRELFAEAGLGDKLSLPREMAGRRHIYNQFVVRFPGGARDRVMEHLKSASIGCEVYYPLTLPQQKCFAGLGCGDEPYPESDRASKETLAIPIYPELTDEQLREVVGQIAKALQSQ